jgi:hypothetical protein
MQTFVRDLLADVGRASPDTQTLATRKAATSA